MSKPRPSFLDSPYFVPEVDNWHLTDNAPEEVKQEFEKYMKSPDCVEINTEEEYIKYLEKMYKGQQNTVK